MKDIRYLTKRVRERERDTEEISLISTEENNSCIESAREKEERDVTHRMKYSKLSVITLG